MALPISNYSLTIYDNTLKQNGTPESTNFSVPIITLTPANVAATSTLVGNLQTALAAITLGQFAKSEITYSKSLLGASASADPLAQRENKWLMRFHDATSFQKFQASVGTADLTFHIDNSEYIDLGTGAGAALKTAFEAVVVSPADAAHSVVLDSVQFVGRNT